VKLLSSPAPSTICTLPVGYRPEFTIPVIIGGVVSGKYTAIGGLVDQGRNITITEYNVKQLTQNNQYSFDFSFILA